MIAGLIPAWPRSAPRGRGDLDLRGAQRRRPRGRAAAGATATQGTPGQPGPGASDDVPVRMLDIPADTFQGAYNDIANSALWFVHHMLFDTPNQPGSAGVPPRLGGLPGATTRPSPTPWPRRRRQAPDGGLRVLIQDYHLAWHPGCSGAARPRRAAAAGSRTSRTPVGAAGLLPAAARRPGRAVLDGMLGADRAGFLRRWADAFLDCCRPCWRPGGRGHGPGSGRSRHRGHVTDVGRAPPGRGRAPRCATARRRRRRAQHGALAAAAERPQADRPGRPDRAVQEHRARPGRLPGAAGHPAAMARPGRAPGLRLPVPVGLPEYRAYTEQVRRLAERDHAGVRHPGLEPGDAGGQGRLRALAGGLRWPTCCWSTRSGTA